ncbi:hypothetical protein WOLCODRAFT_140869 [Wolfiporia cocos MD-104 SS10]|uniref:CFEM domain-containing protein n=1 Tax=Wolfiporia cocos (strain MD-104) TaxID=742152 RepID=A0A2H3JFD7_WOLCO|nr:hypothetical protein WOLCODRAFT_140869 [Wolfiporia cocos MD-104 SS10]
MRTAAAFFALAAALATASAAAPPSAAPHLLRRQGFPTCADSCLENADLDGCNESDDTCLCHSQAFVNSVTACIAAACSGSDLQEADSDAQQLCLAVGVTLTASAAASTGSGSSAAPTSTSTSAATQTQTSGARTNGVHALAGVAAVIAAALAL